MSRPKSAKVYIRAEGGATQFMWANVMRDETVMLGFPWDAKQQVELVMDDKGDLRPPELIAKEVVGMPKISFHPSGLFKLTALMGECEEAVDRVTVNGPPLADIVGPERMVEVLLPEHLPRTDSQPTENDIVLTIPKSPKQPLRCTISCVALAKVDEVLRGSKRFVNTSLWEFSHALQNETHAWIWTLRASCNDDVFVDRIKVVLLGPVKWGNRLPAAP